MGSSAGGKKPTQRKSPDKKKPGRPRLKTPRTRKPEGMSLEEWQRTLRREFGQIQEFEIENLGDEPYFSEFMVTNPKSKGRYRVAIRGDRPGDNFCSCPDFSVNTLGTCKHIEFTLHKLKKKRGAKTAFMKGFTPVYSEIYLRYGQKREVIFKAGSECPESILELAGKYFSPEGLLLPESYGNIDVFLKEAGKNGHELRFYEDAIGFIARVRDRRNLEKAVDRGFAVGVESIAFKKLLKIPLYPYQKEGALFAARAGRSLIADDMGLGKTIQAIAACEILTGAAGLERVLIICPTSLKHQWKDEIERFTNRTVEVVEGLKARRESCYESNTFYKIINYEIVYRDRKAIEKWSPDLIILDEAQRIKNWKTRTAQSVKRLESRFALVLTGTPLENRLEELHSIVEFVDRFKLGPLFRFLAEHQLTDESGGTGKVVGYKNLSQIAKTLAPILIRRAKGEVLRELPERLEKKFFVEMTDQQREHHAENQDIVTRIAAKWRRHKYLSETDQRRLMIALQNMRMSCNSTYLLDEKTDYGHKADELVILLGEIFEDPEAKAVVFSQWTRTHELIVRRIESNGFNHVYFHGGVPGPKRRELIDRFKNDPDCRLFLSTDAGGVGLNLQNASVVINMDQPWNPAVLEQRIGRVHRLGQHRPVRIINFIASGTIEHGMLSVLKFKKSLFSGVLDGGQNEVFLGGTRLNKFMESVEKATGAIPETVSTPEDPVPDLEVSTLEETTPSKEAALTAAAQPEAAWADLAAAGLAFMDKLGQALGVEREQTKRSPQEIVSSLIERDSSGQPYLKLPVPKPDTLKKVIGLIYEITGRK